MPLDSLDRHIAAMGLQVGGSLTLSADQLRALGVTPRLNVNRVTYWDPVMGKGNALQSVIRKHMLVPIAFKWAGDHHAHPTLSAVTLVKWGSICRR